MIILDVFWNKAEGSSPSVRYVHWFPSEILAEENKKAYYLRTPLGLLTRGLEGEGLRYRASLLALAVVTVSFVVLSVPILCNVVASPIDHGQFDAGSLAKGQAKSALDVDGDSDSAALNDTALAQWAATIIAGSLALIALVVALMVVAMFRRQSKEGGR
jgi:ABC-type Fe3+ transport system permease subunit